MRNEEQLRAAFERASEGDGFAKALAAMLSTYLDAAEVTRENVAGLFAAADVPTKADLARLSARIDALTNAVDALSQELRSRKRGRGKTH